MGKKTKKRTKFFAICGLAGLLLASSPSTSLAKENTYASQDVDNSIASTNYVSKTYEDSSNGKNKSDLDYADVESWMEKDVEEIIENTNYTKLDDKNYDQKVIGGSKPSFVLFYNNQGEYSSGLATLAKLLHNDFPEKIDFFVYKLSESEEKTTLKQSPGTNNPYNRTPALLFYSEDNKGNITYVDQIHGGMNEKEPVISMYKKYSDEFIPKNLLDQ